MVLSGPHMSQKSKVLLEIYGIIKRKKKHLSRHYSDMHTFKKLKIISIMGKFLTGNEPKG